MASCISKPESMRLQFADTKIELMGIIHIPCRNIKTFKDKWLIFEDKSSVEC
jgi:hypothetical protein